MNRVTQHKAYIVATCDKDLKRRIRKLPGVPIMYLTNLRYSIERMPDAYGAYGVTSNIKLVNAVLGWSNTLKFIFIRFLTIIPRK